VKANILECRRSQSYSPTNDQRAFKRENYCGLL